MSRLLVPIDSTEGSRTALPVANWLAREMQAEIELLYVAEQPEVPEQEEEEEAYFRRLAGDALSEISGVTVRPRVEKTTDPVRGILRAIEDDGIDMVVMATHDRSELAKLAKGSIADEVVRSAGIPVTLVRRENGKG